MSAQRIRGIEKRVVLTFAMSTLVPMLLLGWIVYAEAVRQTLVQAESALRSDAKNYGLVLTERLNWQSGRNLQTMHVDQLMLIDYEDDDARFLVGGDTMTLEDWLWDLGNGRNGRCVEIDGQMVRCANLPDAGDVLHQSWNLFLGGSFKPSFKVVVHAYSMASTELEGISALAELLPLVALLTSLVVCSFAIRFLRQRFRPLKVLQDATRRVAKGDYHALVEIRSNDEFEELGAGFNRMSSSLARSFDTMRQLAAIDRMILTESGLHDIVQQVLEAASVVADAELEVFLWQAEVGHDITRHRLVAGIFSSTVLSSADLPGIDDWQNPQQVGATVRALSGLPQVHLGLPILVGEATTGCMLISATDDVDSAVFSSLSDFCDRLAVAVTNTRRSENLFRQAHFDALTGLLNRPAFEEQLKQAIRLASRSGRQAAFLFIDVDRFKQVNDTEGHKAGDRLLKIVAARIESCLREDDTIARFGGDEFGLLIRDVENDSSLIQICRRIIAAVEEPTTVDRIEHAVSISIGVAMFPGDANDAGELFMRADTAMYRAKELGGGTVCFYDEALNERTRTRVIVESRLRKAIASGGLRLCYQPKLNLQTGRIDGAEGLMRWTDAELGEVSPAVFVPVAEETGLIHEFLGLCLEHVRQALDHFAREGVVISRVAINTSPKQIAGGEFANRLISQCAAHGLAPERLEVELTESLIVRDREMVIRELNKLRDSGITIALDDFGTGYSSLNMLRELPIDVLKIDQSFIRDIAESREAFGLVEKVIQIAALLSKSVVAEGVETAEQLELLRSANCHYVQGFYIAPSLPPGEFIEFCYRQPFAADIRPARRSPGGR